MECCDFCRVPLMHGELARNPRYGHDLCDFCASEMAVAVAMDDVEAEAA